MLSSMAAPAAHDAARDHRRNDHPGGAPRAPHPSAGHVHRGRRPSKAAMAFRPLLHRELAPHKAASAALAYLALASRRAEQVGHRPETQHVEDVK
jgi:hypothetical protein